MKKRKIVVEVPCKLSNKEIKDKMYTLTYKVQDALGICHSCGSKLRYGENSYCEDCLYPNTCIICGGKSGKLYREGEKYHVCGKCNIKTRYILENIMVLVCRNCGHIMKIDFKEEMLKFDEEQNEHVGTEAYADVRYYSYKTECKKCKNQILIRERLPLIKTAMPTISSKDVVIILSPKLKRQADKDTYRIVGFCPEVIGDGSLTFQDMTVNRA